MQGSQLVRVFFFLFGCLLVLPAGLAWADLMTVNGDFNADDPTSGTSSSGTFSALGADPAGGTHWNGIDTGTRNTPTATFTSPTLSESDGTTNSGITVTLTTFAPYDTFQDNTPASFAPALLNDGAYAPSGTAGFSFNHLLASGTYDLYLYAQNGGFNNNITHFTIGSTTLTASANSGNGTGFVNNGNYVLFTDLSAAGGTISGGWTGSTTNPFFDGFQLVLVPEPTSFALAGLGAIALAIGALRRRLGQTRC